MYIWLCGLMTNAEHVVTSHECLNDVITEYGWSFSVDSSGTWNAFFLWNKENTYWTSHITSSSGSSLRLWRCMSSVVGRDGATTILPSECVNAAGLVKFFVDKVDDVRAATENAPPPSYSSFSTDCSWTNLMTSKLMTFDKLYFQLNKNLLCSLDPLPTTVLFYVWGQISESRFPVCSATDSDQLWCLDVTLTLQDRFWWCIGVTAITVEYGL